MWPSEPNVQKLKQMRDLPGLIKALQAKDGEVASMAMAAVVEIDNDDAYVAFASTLINATKEIRDKMRTAVIKTPGATDWLRKCILTHPGSSFRTASVQLLAEVDESNIVLNLVQALYDEDELVACHAAESLGAIRDERSAGALLQAVASGRQWLSQEAGKALGQLGSQHLLDDIVKLCHDENRYIRRGAAEAIVGVGGSDVATALVPLLRDCDRDVRRLARIGLARLGDIGRETAERELGPGEASRLLTPDAHRAERKDELKEQRKELEGQMSDCAKITEILSSLRPLKPSDSWLHEAITVDEFWDSLEDGMSYVRAERLQAGKHLNIQEAAEATRKFWRYAWTKIRVSGYAGAKVESRSVTVQKHKLTIQVKGTVGQDQPSAAQLTVARLSEDEFLVL